MSTDDVKLWRKPSKSSIASSKSVVKWNGAGHDGGGHLWFSKGTGYVKPVKCISAWKNLFSTLCNFVANHTTIQRSICKLCVCLKFTSSNVYWVMCIYCRYILLMLPQIIKTYVQLLFNRFTTEIKQIAVCQSLLTVESCSNIPTWFYGSSLINYLITPLYCSSVVCFNSLSIYKKNMK